MNSTKLLTLTSRIYLIIFLVLMLFFFGIFYFIIRSEVLRSTDEILYNKKTHIIERFKENNGHISEEVFDYTDFVITPVDHVPHRRKSRDKFTNEMRYEKVDNELDEFRKLTSYFDFHGKTYRIEIVNARMERHEIIESIIKSLFLVLILMVIVFYVTTRYFSKKLWQPFYHTLQQLNQFEVDQVTGLDLTASRIEEFVLLNNSILELTDRTRNTFVNQKQFIENASHEMQTPLAIAQSKLELLIEDPNLTEHQSEIIQTLINSTQRLSKLNKTLLLLSKIENQQFLKKENIALAPLIKQTLTYFEEQQENLNLKVSVEIAPGASVDASPMLLDLLATNLIKNAFFHNHQHGFIHIEVDNTQFSVSNTSAGDIIPQEKLFERFYKQSANKDSWGLGLAIVKKICSINLWRIDYSKVDEHHTFTVKF